MRHVLMLVHFAAAAVVRSPPAGTEHMRGAAGKKGPAQSCDSEGGGWKWKRWRGAGGSQCA